MALGEDTGRRYGALVRPWWSTGRGDWNRVGRVAGGARGGDEEHGWRTGIGWREVLGGAGESLGRLGRWVQRHWEGQRRGDGEGWVLGVGTGPWGHWAGAGVNAGPWEEALVGSAVGGGWAGAWWDWGREVGWECAEQATGILAGLGRIEGWSAEGSWAGAGRGLGRGAGIGGGCSCNWGVLGEVWGMLLQGEGGWAGVLRGLGMP